MRVAETKLAANGFHESLDAAGYWATGTMYLFYSNGSGRRVYVSADSLAWQIVEDGKKTIHGEGAGSLSAALAR